MKKRRACLGFGPTEGKCGNPAGCAHTPLWCDSCNEARMNHIAKCFSGCWASKATLAEREAGQDDDKPHIKTHRSTGRGRSFMTGVPVKVRLAKQEGKK